MKVHKPNTDQECECYITCGGKPYAEYVRDPETTSSTPKPNTFESFIPVADGEQIAIHIRFRGTVLHGAADVLADGAFVFDRRIEGDKKGHVKYQKRDWKVDEVYNVPGRTDAEAMNTGTAIVAGHLIIKNLHEGDVPLFVKPTGKLGLGNIAVIISVNQDVEEMHNCRYQHQTVGKWRDIRVNQADGGIKPMHELQFRLEDDEVHFNRQQRHRRHLEQARFGLQPWAVFVFHYRSQADIQSAGCIRRSEGPHALEPYLGEFTFADPNAIIKKRLATRARNDFEKMETEAAEDDFGFDGYGTLSNARSPEASEGLFVSRSPSVQAAQTPKRGLFGNPLGMQSAVEDGVRKDSYISEQEIKTESQEAAHPAEDWQRLFGDDEMINNHTGDTSRTLDAPQDIISANNQSNDFDFSLFPDMSGAELSTEIDQALLAGGFDIMQAPITAPVAKMVMSSSPPPSLTRSQQSDHGEVVQSVETSQDDPHWDTSPHLRQPQAEGDGEESSAPSPLAQMISSAVQDKVDERKAANTARAEAKAAKKERPPPGPKGKPIVDPTAKTGYGYGNPNMRPQQHMVPTQEAMQQLDVGSDQMQGMLQNYLQAQPEMQRFASEPNTLQQATPYQRPWETAEPRSSGQHAQFPMSPPAQPGHPNVSSSKGNMTSQPRPDFPHTPAQAGSASIVPRKRAGSIISRESTPGSSASKRVRLAEHAAKVAAMKAELDERNKAKAAAQKQVDEERQAREELERRREEEQQNREREEEEAQAREIAELQTQLDGVERDTGDILEQGRREHEDARMRELEWMREH